MYSPEASPKVQEEEINDCFPAISFNIDSPKGKDEEGPQSTILSHTDDHTTEIKLNFLDSPGSSDCIDRDLDAILDGFKTAIKETDKQE